ncbi:MAG: nucleotidyltransferase [Ilumatobacteraceae bacterium]|nr:nucleotidyltransferase [Ilumatobacteraceae bacterium]
MTIKTTSQAFDELDENLKLDPRERARAIKIHNEITAALIKVQLAIAAFLQGSFARKTMLAPLRDIDKVLILAWDPNDKGPGSASRAAHKVAGTLRDLYPNHTVTIGKHCVKLELDSDDFTFDIVPAVETDDGTGDVWIIDTEQDRWERSNTRTLISIIQQRNQDCDGRWVRQVRFVKLFVREQLDGIVPGLHVEKYTWDSVKDNMPHDGAVAAILAKGAELLAPGTTYTEPTGRDRIDHRLSTVDRQRAHTEFTRAAAAAAKAVTHARNGEHNAAIAIWHSLFGDDFSKPDERSAIKALDRGAGIAGTVTSTAPVKAPKTRSWRPGA